MKRTILLALATMFAGFAAPAQFLPKHLAVLRAGDGEVDLHLKQSPVFIDQFAPGNLNPAPSFTVAIPTNGVNAIFFNGHAATEGILARSADHRLLSFAGYGGVGLLQFSGTPSLLDIARAFCTVDAAGKIHTTIYKKNGSEEKMNPRGVVTDGENNFWGCGNSSGTFYYHPGGSREMIDFTGISSTRSIKIINHTLYTSLNGPDGAADALPPGIFSFEENSGNPAALPRTAGATLKSVVAIKAPYSKIAGFDMNPEGTIAYIADTTAGVQKYGKTNGAWAFAYNFPIPQNIPAADNHATGCFALVADFSASTPVVFATTTEGYNGCVNSNRVVQIVDTGASAAVTTLAQAPSAKIAYRGIDFTPETGPTGRLAVEK